MGRTPLVSSFPHFKQDRGHACRSSTSHTPSSCKSLRPRESLGLQRSPGCASHSYDFGGAGDIKRSPAEFSALVSVTCSLSSSTSQRCRQRCPYGSSWARPPSSFKG